MRVTILPDRETKDVQAANVGALLKALGLHQDAYLVVRGDEILTRDVRLRADDQVDVIPVISGGRAAGRPPVHGPRRPWRAG